MEKPGALQLCLEVRFSGMMAKQPFGTHVPGRLTDSGQASGTLSGRTMIACGMYRSTRIAGRGCVGSSAGSRGSSTSLTPLQVPFVVRPTACSHVMVGF